MIKSTCTFMVNNHGVCTCTVHVFAYAVICQLQCFSYLCDYIIELTVDEIPSSYLSNETVESSNDETEEGLSWMSSTSSTPTSRAK